MKKMCTGVRDTNIYIIGEHTTVAHDHDDDYAPLMHTHETDLDVVLVDGSREMTGLVVDADFGYISLKASDSPIFSLIPTVSNVGYPTIRMTDVVGISRGLLELNLNNGNFALRRISNIGATEAEIELLVDGNAALTGGAEVPTAPSHLTRRDFVERVAAHVAPPVTASSTGVAGNIAFDTSFVYVCVATNTWLRSPLTTW